MQPRDFVYWLQGFFEITSANGQTEALTAAQAEMIRKHLALVLENRTAEGALNKYAVRQPNAIGPIGAVALTSDRQWQAIC